jgi:hypothetical protein
VQKQVADSGGGAHLGLVNLVWFGLVPLFRIPGCVSAEPGFRFPSLLDPPRDVRMAALLS